MNFYRYRIQKQYFRPYTSVYSILYIVIFVMAKEEAVILMRDLYINIPLSIAVIYDGQPPLFLIPGFSCPIYLYIYPEHKHIAIQYIVYTVLYSISGLGNSSFALSTFALSFFTLLLFALSLFALSLFCSSLFCSIALFTIFLSNIFLYSIYPEHKPILIYVVYLCVGNQLSQSMHYFLFTVNKKTLNLSCS